MMANNISLLLLRVWDVSAASIAAGAFGGVWRLTLLTSALQALGVVGVVLLPTSVRHQRERQRKDRSSRSGACVGWVGGQCPCDAIRYAYSCSRSTLLLLLPNGLGHPTQKKTGGLAFVGFVVAAFVWTVAADAYVLATGRGEGAD